MTSQFATSKMPGERAEQAWMLQSSSVMMSPWCWNRNWFCLLFTGELATDHHYHVLRAMAGALGGSDIPTWGGRAACMGAHTCLLEMDGRWPHSAARESHKTKAWVIVSLYNFAVLEGWSDQKNLAVKSARNMSMSPCPWPPAVKGLLRKRCRNGSALYFLSSIDSSDISRLEELERETGAWLYSRRDCMAR